MTSKERVRAALSHQKPDRVPVAFEATHKVVEKLLKRYNLTTKEDLLKKFDVDIYPISAKYNGRKLKKYKDEHGREVKENYWGFENTMHETELDSYGVTTFYPLKGVETVEEVEAYNFPNADDFDYTPITNFCKSHPDKAIIIGHEGPFQIVTNLLPMEEFFILMLEEPEVAAKILEKMNEFELAYYEKCFIAGEGQIDILRTHDDYGTQISMLFSTDLWEEFFKENTKKLVALTHKYGAFFQQHSCGAVGPIIPYLIECDVDSLEPLQKVASLELENLAKYKGQIAFHGGIDTQQLLPKATPEEITAEVDSFIKTLAQDGGYILMASQSFEIDAKVENIEAIYNANRYI